MALYRSGTILRDGTVAYHSEIFNHPPFPAGVRWPMSPAATARLDAPHVRRSGPGGRFSAAVR